MLHPVLPQGSCEQCLIQCAQEMIGAFTSIKTKIIKTVVKRRYGVKPWMLWVPIPSSISRYCLTVNPSARSTPSGEQQNFAIILWDRFGNIEKSITISSKGDADAQFGTQLSRVETREASSPWILGQACIASEAEQNCEIEIEGNIDAAPIQLTTHPNGVPFILELNEETITPKLLLTPTNEQSVLSWLPFVETLEADSLIPVECTSTFTYSYNEDEKLLDCNNTAQIALNSQNELFCL